MYKSLILEPLGLFGWSYLEPIILASLASEYPLLLIGKHGSAKSFILEGLAESLNIEYRNYNASLINYDDLVGIPVPINNNTSLSYISNPNSIWEAEVVFIDEINRTKPELQNKLFPIIYDKRVQGIKLEKLKYRWAAMNPYNNDDDEENEDSYFGTMPLDIALEDRFPFIIEVPTWDDLSLKDKQLILKNSNLARKEFPVDINELIKSTKEYYRVIFETNKEAIANYIIDLIDLLRNSLGYLSTRRATMMQDTLIYLYAAFKAINEYNNFEFSFNDICYLHIQCSIPNYANKKIDKTQLISTCQQAIKLSKLDDSLSKEILLTQDPIKKLKILIKNKNVLDDDMINDAITSSLNEINDPKIRRAMALFTYLSFRKNENIYPTVIETLANEIRPILESYEYRGSVILSEKKCCDTVVSLLHSVPDDKKYKKYLNNYLCSYLPDKYIDINGPKSLTAFFMSTWEELFL